MNTVLDPNHPVVLFIPEAGIYPYMRALAILGDSITQEGGRVLVTHDTGQMLRSPMMSSKRMPVEISPEQRSRIRESTEKNIRYIKEKYNFSFIEFSDLVDDKLMAEINGLTESYIENLDEIIFRGFPVGKIALYDFVLETKSLYSSKLSAEHKALYTVYIKNTALALALTDKICEKYTPSLFLTFNEYAQGQAVRYSAERHNVSRLAVTNPTHLNVDGSRISVWKSTYDFWMESHAKKWPVEKTTPISPHFVNQCWNNTIFRMYSSGSHMFSPRKENDPYFTFEKLQLSDKRKTIVAYTSSPDELVSAQVSMKIWKEDNQSNQIFDTQIEWLSFLKDYVEKRNDVQVVVRIHPREGSRGFGFDSEHLKQLKKAFPDSNEKFKIIWPDNPISSYDLLELADVCLTAYSNMAHEGARVGIPGLSCTTGILYSDGEFIETAKTQEEYENNLNAILQKKPDWNTLVKAVRFYHWRTFIPTLDFGNTVPVEFQDGTIWPKAPKHLTKIVDAILSGKKDLITYSIEEWKKSITKDSKKYETEAMQQGIRKFLDKIFYPPNPPIKTYTKNILVRTYRLTIRKIQQILRKLTGNNLLFTKQIEYPYTDYQLEYNADPLQIETLIQRSKLDSGTRILLADGLYSILIHNGKVLRRMSPMVNRLAHLYTQSFHD